MERIHRKLISAGAGLLMGAASLIQPDSASARDLIICARVGNYFHAFSDSKGMIRVDHFTEGFDRILVIAGDGNWSIPVIYGGVLPNRRIGAKLTMEMVEDAAGRVGRYRPEGRNFSEGKAIVTSFDGLTMVQALGMCFPLN